jgi:hypothetical protein
MGLACLRAQYASLMAPRLHASQLGNRANQSLKA